MAIKLIKLYNRAGQSVSVDSRDTYRDFQNIRWLGVSDKRLWSSVKPVKVDTDPLNELRRLNEPVFIGPFTLNFGQGTKAITRENRSTRLLFDKDGRAVECWNTDYNELLATGNYYTKHPSLIKK